MSFALDFTNRHRTGEEKKWPTMKIDFEKLERLAAAGATAQVIIEVLRIDDVKKEKKRKRDAKRMGDLRATNGDKARPESETERLEATSPTKKTDVNRTRIFALRPRLVALGLEKERAGTVLGQFCKITHDNAQAIETAITEAELKRPADAIGYIRACLQERKSINGQRPSVTEACDDLIARAEVSEREAGLG